MKPSNFKQIAFSATAGLLATLAAANFVFADTLSDSDKAQKRQELADFFSNVLARTRPEAAKPAWQEWQFSVNGSTRYGYDSNVDLSSSNKDGDYFYQERIGGSVEYLPEAFSNGESSLGAGMDARYDYWGYFDRDDLNRQNLVLSPHLRWNPGRTLQVEAAYLLRIHHYNFQDDLNYISNGARLTVSHEILTGLTQKGEFLYEHEGYSKRKFLLSDSFFGDSDREDNRYQLTYGLRERMGPWTFNLEGDWLWNDSNDEFFNYNDYQEGGLDGSVALRLTQRLVLTGFGGWQHREYDERPIASSTSTLQRDNWYFSGGRLFYAINTWSGVDATFTYYKNDSNDPGHRYDAAITSVGYHLYF